MLVCRLVRVALVPLFILSSSACGEGPTSPTGIGSPPSLNLTGTWVGPLGPPQTNISFRATWTASQTGSAVSGPVAMFRASDNVAFDGTLAGVLSGTRLSLTYAVPRGNVPGAPDCTISATGTIDATATLLAGTMNMTAPNCEAISLLPSAVGEIALVKQ
jgi:hypothetical protein